MTCGPKVYTESKLAARVKNGLGVGDGADYRPAIRIQDFSSRGVQTRIPSETLGRTVHTHSYLERALFLVMEFSGRLLEYKEQFPMDRAITLGAASQLNIKHPVYPKSRIPLVMTIDAVATMRAPSGTVETTAWDAKPHDHLSNPRVLEKLSLHKAYCAHAGIAHRIFTERSLPKTVVKNIDWLRASRYREGELEVVHGLFSTHAATMLTELRSGNFKSTIRDYGLSFDRRHALPPGSGLRVLKQLAWTRSIQLNMNADPVELQPLPRPRHVVAVDCREEALQ